MSKFRIPITPRELTDDEYKELISIYYHDGTKIKPSFESTSNIWIDSYDDDLPVYRLYNCGTNCLKVLMYITSKDAWVLIELKDISNLYGFIWKLIIEKDFINELEG